MTLLIYYRPNAHSQWVRVAVRSTANPQRNREMVGDLAREFKRLGIETGEYLGTQGGVIASFWDARFLVRERKILVPRTRAKAFFAGWRTIKREGRRTWVRHDSRQRTLWETSK